MAILGYMFALAISFIPVLIILIFMILKKTFSKSVNLILIAPFVYMFICTLNFGLFAGINDYRDKPLILSAEQDFLLGVDRIYLYEDNTFYIEYADHNYYGNYVMKDNFVKLNIERKLFLPLRPSFPSQLEILADRIIDPVTQDQLFDVY